MTTEAEDIRADHVATTPEFEISFHRKTTGPDPYLGFSVINSLVIHDGMDDEEIGAWVRKQIHRQETTRRDRARQAALDLGWE